MTANEPWSLSFVSTSGLPQVGIGCVRYHVRLLSQVHLPCDVATEGMQVTVC